jgi:hypothetical protein
VCGGNKPTLLAELPRSIERPIYLNLEVIVKYGADLLDVLNHSEIEASDVIFSFSVRVQIFPSR